MAAVAPPAGELDAGFSSVLGLRQRSDAGACRPELRQSVLGTDHHRRDPASRRIALPQRVCAFTHSRMASFTRVCQPLPVPFSASSTSASKRIVVGILGLASLGRPIRRICANSASVTSWVSGSAAIPALIAASSSGVGTIRVRPLLVLIVCCIELDLSQIRLAQADDAAPIGAIREHHAKQSPSCIRNKANHAQLAVLAPGIRLGEQPAPVHPFCQRQGQAMFCLVGSVFVWVERDPHGIYCTNKYSSPPCDDPRRHLLQPDAQFRYARRVAHVIPLERIFR